MLVNIFIKALFLYICFAFFRRMYQTYKSVKAFQGQMNHGQQNPFGRNPYNTQQSSQKRHQQSGDTIEAEFRHIDPDKK